MSDTLLLGAVAYHPRVVTVWERFREYFRDADVELDYLLYSNYERLVDAAVNGDVDIAWNTNTAYVDLDERVGGATAILGMRDADREWATVIVVPRGRSLVDLSDLAGTTLALGSRDSGHAAILPLHYLAQAGLRPDIDLRTVRFDTDLGKHGDTGDSELQVVRAVAGGDADAGAISQAYLSVARAERLPEVAGLEVAWRSPTYYHCNFTALGDLDDSPAREFTAALLAMDYNEPGLRPAMDLEGVRRWYPGDETGYASLREAVRDQDARDRAGAGDAPR